MPSMRAIRLDNHPFPFLLYGEWVLIAIALISEFSPSVLPHGGGFPGLALLVVLGFGALGLWLPTYPLALKEEVAQAVRAVHRGYAQFGPGILQKMVVAQPSPPKPEIPPGFDELTLRERQGLVLIGQGASNREIAQALFLSEVAVKNHVTNISGRLGLRDRTQAALFAASLQLDEIDGHF
ncbi:MAG: response regulator transcription factor [Cyanobacteria bacterium J06638_28]